LRNRFVQQNIEPGEIPEGVLAFAEPYRDRVVLPIDEPSDQLYRLITHELTHIFEFDIIPRTLLHHGLPPWVDEGLANYMAGYWNPFAASVQQYRTTSFSYINLSRRLQYALQAFSQTQFYYGYQPGVLFGYNYAWLDRDQAIATQTARGATAFAIYPFNRYARIELTAGVLQFSQGFNEPGLQDLANDYQQQQFGRVLFSSGSFMPLGIAYVQETTVFREYGPLAGNTVRIGYEYAPKVGNSMLSRQTADVDARYYLRLATNGVLAFRARGFKSWGEWPGYLYFGGNSELRGYDYLEFLGQKAFFGNAELRFPLLEAALTPIGVIGGLRAVAFFNIGAAGYDDVPMTVWTKSAIPYRPLLG
jgi:hypothetical protein